MERLLWNSSCLTGSVNSCTISRNLKICFHRAHRPASIIMKTQNHLQLFSLILSMVIFGTIGLFRKYIPLPSAVLACARGFMGSAFLLLLNRARGSSFSFKAVSGHTAGLIISGALIGFNWILLFEAYNYTTVAIATLCYYLQPVIVIALSPLVLRERITTKKVICILLSLLGMVLVSGIRPGDSPAGGNLYGILLGLGAAMLYASVVLMNKKIAGVPVYEKTILQLFSASAVLVPYLAVSGSLQMYHLEAGPVLALLTVGLLHTGIAYALYFWSVERLPAQTSALFSYIDPVTAVLLSALLLHEPMTLPAAAGAVLILGSAIASER